MPLVEVLDRAGTIPGALRGRVPRRRPRHGRGRRRTPICFERSLSLDDARGSEALLAYAMNGEPLPRPARLPAAAHRPGVVRRDVGQVADRHRGHRPRLRRRSSRPSATVYEWERDGDDRPGAGPPPAGPIADHRADAARGRRRRRRRHPRRRVVRCSAHRPRRREHRRRALAAGPHGRRTPPSLLAVVGAAHPHRRARRDDGAGPGHRPRRPHPARPAPSGTASATAATPSRPSTYGSADIEALREYDGQAPDRSMVVRPNVFINASRPSSASGRG